MVAAVLLSVASIRPVAAETTWEVLQRFGLTGTWAVSCNARSTRTNFFETYFKDSNGLARREVDWGAETPVGVSFLDSAQIISPTVLKGRIRNADPNWGAMNNLTYDFVITIENNPANGEIYRFRFLESKRSDGKVIARGGLFATLGKPTFWVYKCRQVVSALRKK
jgi:hypothetical protein